MKNQGMVIIWAIVGMAILTGGIIIQASCERGRLDDLKGQNAELAAKVEERNRNILTLTAEKNMLASANEGLRKDVEETRARASSASRRVKPAPGPVPVEEAALKADLEEAGLEVGLAFHKEGASKMLLGDAQKAWTWNQQALRVPSFEAALAAEKDLTKALDLRVGGLTTEVGKTNLIIKECELRKEDWGRLEGNYKATIKQQDVVILAEKRVGKTKLYWGLGIGAAAGIALDRIIRK